MEMDMSSVASSEAPSRIPVKHWSDRKLSYLQLFNGAQRLKPIQRAIAGLIEKKAKHVPQPMILNSFKKAMFGQWFSKFLHRSMRQSQHWTKIETELFGGFTAHQLGCNY